MTITRYTTLLLLLFSVTLFSQTPENGDYAIPENRFTVTGKNLIKGFSDAVEWYDIPAGVLYLTKNQIRITDSQKPFSVNPASFERRIAGSVGLNGRHSPGSMDPGYLPNLIFYGRLGYSAVNGLLNPENSSSNEFRNAFLMYKSVLYTTLITETAKRLVHRQRPDGSNSESFFSAHTSKTFAAASFLYRETDDMLDNWEVTRNDDALRRVLKGVSFSAYYGWAGYVAYSRMRDNKHYLTDVLLGAAVGTAVSNIIYDFYNGDSGIADNFSLGYLPGGASLQFNLNF